LCLKSQIPSTKSQINLKFQYSTRGASACAARDQNLLERDIVWIFEFWSLEIVCNLQFDIWDFNKSINCQQSKSPIDQDFYL